ncbi:MoaD/ThiS family protein [Roseivirga sp. E12]|uniref:MoaD/ThiS family protein n=1 Tax=Roseivirga sp. E12 TaxID=2819237 RepID=UPI001ABCBE91|nr:MoaD/ThiS family protein [Roseivirga sp. E12]MBO3697218.1 MoaD/ThiS family protein [Roseivirga sp. E12]
MAVVKFTSNLKRFYPDLSPLEVSGKTVSEILNEIETRYTGLKDYIVDENGTLRKHVNIFIGNEMVKDREGLKDELDERDEVYVMQALSGG